jgi:hypothetical protein
MNSVTFPYIMLYNYYNNSLQITLLQMDNNYLA